MTNEGNVAAFGCGRAHPVHGEAAACIRQRAHPGDHRTEYGGQLLTWPDPPAPKTEHPRDHFPGIDSALTSTPTYPFEPTKLPGERRWGSIPGRLEETDEAWHEGHLDPVRVLAWLTIVALCSVWPLVMVLLIRSAV